MSRIERELIRILIFEFVSKVKMRSISIQDQIFCGQDVVVWQLQKNSVGQKEIECKLVG